MLTEGLPEGFSVAATAVGSRTDAGTSPSRVESYTIFNMYGEDVTDRFTNIQTVDGNLTVYPLPITVWTGSAIKGYDGTPLTEDAAAILETDAAVNPAPRSNLGYVDAAEAQECLYILTGTVTVYAANPITGETKQIDVSAGSRLRVTLRSDRTTDSIAFTVEPVSEKDLPEGVLRLLGADSRLLLNACDDTHWDPLTMKLLIGGLPDDPDAPEDRLVENRADVRVTADTAEAEIHITGIARADGISVRATGAQTEVGESANTYEIVWGSALPGNYAVSERLGVLRVLHVHRWDEGRVTVEATCVSQGEKRFTCLDCGKTKAETIPADPQNHAKTVVTGAYSATCGRDGYSGDTVCAACGEKVAAGRTIRATGKHTWDGGTVIVSPTCVSAGEISYRCKVCGATQTESMSIDPSIHVGTRVTGERAATCAADGYTGDTVCTGCGATLSAGSAIPATGAHSGSARVTAVPSCVSTGQTVYTCTICGLTTSQTTPADPSNHVNTTTVGAYPATCGAAGYTGDTVCLDCKATVSTGTAIPATGAHSFEMTSFREVVDPNTGMFTGTEYTYTCSVCGYSYTSNE